MSRAALLVALLLAAAGCRSGATRFPLPAEDPRPRALLQAWQESVEARHALRGSARLAVDGEGLTVRARQILVVERPSRLRVEVQGLLSQTLAVLVTDGPRYQLFRAEDRSIESGEVHAGLLWQVASLDLTPEEAIELVLGAPRLDASLAPVRASQTREGEIAVELGDAGGRVQERRSFDAQGLLRGVERLGPDGQPVWSARFDQYQPLGSVPFAHAIRVEAPRRSARAELVLSGVELNPVLPADIFRLQPAGARAGGMGGSLVRFAAVALAVLLAACTNNPYPDADDARAIFYTIFDEPPKTLDPQVAYSVNDHAVIGNVYDTLLEYHYLKRPYTLIPGLLEEIPQPRPVPDGRVAYTLRLRDGLLFHEDPCFELSAPGARTRAVTAADVVFAFQRIGDPAVGSPVFETLVKVSGLRAFAEQLAQRREDPAFAALRIERQYAEVGGVSGLRVKSPRELELLLDEPYPQIRFWLAMNFTSPVPWEAVAYYDGAEGRDHFAEHPVGTGPFRITRYDKRARIALEREPSWYGARDPGAPGTVFPREGAREDAERGFLDAERAGRPLPFLDGIEFRREKEDITAFSKFLQGYYDISGIPQESFDRMVHEGALSPEMRAMGMQLAKSVAPDVYYLGFNMDDPVVGAPAGARGRKLRQAMSLVVDVEEFKRLFTNGRGIAAQSPIPPSIFGYESEYRNPFRRVDPGRAAALLAEAGYPGGIDPKTGKPLRLTFDTPSTDTRSLLTFQFWVDGWRRLGLDVEIAATSYNKFQEKVRNGAFQIFQFGWVADYPDPENFLFLLWSGMARSKNGGPNTANFQDPRFDALFERMKARDDDAERLRLIREMRAILEVEAPWIPLFHREGFALYHAWVAPPKPAGLAFAVDKYRYIDPRERAELRAAWNRPIRWPAYALAGAMALVVLPGIATWRRERS